MKKITKNYYFGEKRIGIILFVKCVFNNDFRSASRTGFVFRLIRISSISSPGTISNTYYETPDLQFLNISFIWLKTMHKNATIS